MELINILGIIAAIGTALGVIYKYILHPMEQLSRAVERIAVLDESNKMVLECLLAIMNNIITGNNVDKLKDKRDELEHFCIKK